MLELCCQPLMCQLERLVRLLLVVEALEKQGVLTSIIRRFRTEPFAFIITLLGCGVAWDCTRRKRG